MKNDFNIIDGEITIGDFIKKQYPNVGGMVILFTWAISLKELQKILSMKFDKIILVLDVSFRNRKPKVFEEILKKISQRFILRLANCHAKIICIDELQEIILTSANLNKNKRAEYIFITNQKEIFNKCKKWISLYLKNTNELSRQYISSILPMKKKDLFFKQKIEIIDNKIELKII